MVAKASGHECQKPVSNRLPVPSSFSAVSLDQPRKVPGQQSGALPLDLGCPAVL